jgi:hypothetical protein
MKHHCEDLLMITHLLKFQCHSLRVHITLNLTLWQALPMEALPKVTAISVETQLLPVKQLRIALGSNGMLFEGLPSAGCKVDKKSTYHFYRVTQTRPPATRGNHLMSDLGPLALVNRASPKKTIPPSAEDRHFLALQLTFDQDSGSQFVHSYTN